MPFVIVLFVAVEGFAASPSDASPESEAAGRDVHASGAPPAATTAGPEARNAELLKKHGEIWDLMGLSAGAQEELNGLVVTIHEGIHEKSSATPEAFRQATAPRRSEDPLTHETYVEGHKRRFALLEISEPTQTELLAALELTWKALHDPEVSDEQREVAEKIRALMLSMGGPPPCCDDGIFERAGMAN
jgi:hypothetical protein